MMLLLAHCTILFWGGLYWTPIGVVREYTFFNSPGQLLRHCESDRLRYLPCFSYASVRTYYTTQIWYLSTYRSISA